jgi:hypothetical protein
LDQEKRFQEAIRNETVGKNGLLEHCVLCVQRAVQRMDVFLFYETELLL